jgi:hypothetical protein
MKIITGIKSLINIMILLIVSVIIPSCETLKDDPQYIGSWQYKDKIYSGELVINTTHTLILTKTTFHEVLIYQRDNSSTVMTLIGLKGDIEINGNEMTFKVSAFAECLKDASNNCTSTPEWFAKGTETYNDYLSLGMKETFQGEFEADEDYLWLVRDMNNDSDTEDSMEDIEFDRI